MRKTLGMLLGGLLLLAPAATHAQIAWETPLLLPPRAEPGLGLFLMDVAGGGLGFMASWRAPGWNYGFRGGIAESADDDIGVFAGLDYSGDLHRTSADFPLDVDWVFGAGIGVADGALVTLPLGLSFGHTFRAESASFTPFLTPRIVLDAFFGDQDDEMELGMAIDLGLDLRLSSRGPLAGSIIRFAVSGGDHEGVAIGLVF